MHSPFLKIQQSTVMARSHRHEMKQMDTNNKRKPKTNPYEPSLIDATDVPEITQQSAHHFLSWSMIPSLIACVYGVYHSWSLMQFAGAIVLGIPLTLAALMLNERERIKRRVKHRPVESTLRKSKSVSCSG